MTNLTEERLAEIRGYLESFEKFGTRSMRDQAECSFPLAQEVPFLLEIIDSQKTDLQKAKDAIEIGIEVNRAYWEDTQSGRTMKGDCAETDRILKEALNSLTPPL